MVKPMATSQRGSNLGREEAGDGEEKHEGEAAGGDGHSGLLGGVAHDLLEELGDEHCGRIERDADHEHDEHRGADVSLGEEAQVEDGVFDGELAVDENAEADSSDYARRWR